jgi:hypothetical protein
VIREVQDLKLRLSYTVRHCFNKNKEKWKEIENVVCEKIKKNRHYNLQSTCMFVTYIYITWKIYHFSQNFFILYSLLRNFWNVNYNCNNHLNISAKQI